MSLMLSTVFLIGAAIIGIVIHRQFFSHVASNYINLVLGIMIGLVPMLNHMVATFHSEMFMGMVVAPLLFYDGMETRFYKVAREFRVIISLTIFMALLCSLAAAFGMATTGIVSLPLAFVLAAISTPTDATASEAVAHGLIIPGTERVYLKLESLFNDASGIILLNMAILWYVNGYINYGQTIANFMYSAVGGVIFGFVGGGVIIFLRQALIRSHINLVNTATSTGTPSKIIFLATPFVIYYLAEHLHISGIIAVVCTGVLHNAEMERSNLLNPRVIYDSQMLTGMLKELLNGIVFIILGIMMVRITNNNNVVTHPENWIVLGIIMYVANVIVRFLYTLIVRRLNWRQAMIFAFGGVHGTVTFALAFMVAQTAVRRTDFNLVLMAEAVLIVLSLLVPTFLFRVVLKHRPGDQTVAKKTIQIRDGMIKHAIEKIQRIYLPDELRELILYDLQTQRMNTSIKHFIQEFKRSLRRPGLSPEETNTLDMAYRLAFREEREYLNEVSQQEDMDIITNLYSEILMAEMVVLDH
ncbi:sodium:proton antiporter [uncultured Limosilactobacillus sp.]|uniref:cation:proton antiporter n=1 Tax=uncultured Limosilactobacillus sp. TaxID=2837629 RepID=UPI0025ECECB6|nr:cation:proton antiporter [uncultured Limosilactobacillus sp.]